MHTNIAFQITQEIERIFKIVAHFPSFTKVNLEIPFSKNLYHTETSQLISNANRSVFSNFRSIIDLQKINHLHFNYNTNRNNILYAQFGLQVVKKAKMF